MQQGTSILNFSGSDSAKHLQQVEHVIKRLEDEQQQKDDASCPCTPSGSITTPPIIACQNFWHEMSPQLSYIDGSSMSSVAPSSYGRSVSWNLADLNGPPTAPHSLDPLDLRQDSSNEGAFVPLSSLSPLSRHASDSLCSSLQCSKGVRYKGSLEVPVSHEYSCGLSNCSEADIQKRISGCHSPKLAVVCVQKNDIKCKIKKRLSFGDTLDLQTTIYIPAGEDDSRESADNSREKCLIDDEPFYHYPPLVRRRSLDTHSQTSYYMDKDLRYYFQHPWFRLIVSYLVIFCNFLLFAEDPVSHSHAESSIPIVGNVFSFVAMKYPDEWYWKMIKVIVWLIAILCGMLVGKVLIHGIFFKNILRLKMFRDDQGSWMIMFLTVIVSLYMFSYVYNLILLIGHWDYFTWQIDRSMGVTNENMMKAAATCTWLGDLITAMMVTDMMLQDNLYPQWAAGFRRLYRLSNFPRIMIFWCGSIIVATLVIFLIVSDYISWDNLNKGFVETTELSRAFLASFILVMDLLIVMQDWDFPHFSSTIDVNLPGFYTHTLHWRYAETKVTGKWFNYGIIFLVMLFDLNMWKNQIFYYPENYGQYIDPVSRKVFTVEDEYLLWGENQTIWTWEARGEVDPLTGSPFRDNDMFMYSRFTDCDVYVKCTAFIPNVLGFIMLFTLVTLYGRFPPNQDGTWGGRLKTKKRSSWRRERRTTSESRSKDSNSTDL